MQQFSVITPCLNGGHYIDDTIMSVVAQAGDFSLRYHVQDGGSTDDTLERLEAWSQRLSQGHWPKLCPELKFSYSSEPDEGLYDAINKAFAVAGAEQPSEAMMGWINAGDRLGQGALQSITSIRQQFPEVEWVAGGFGQLNDKGAVIANNPCAAYSQRAIHAGLYDGRRFGFMQQEGVFWSQSLWLKIGQCTNSTLKLAGDFDLWRSLAGYAPCVGINTVTGYFRRHHDGLSSDIDSYLGEIDAVVVGTAAAERDSIHQEYNILRKNKDKNGLAEAGFIGPIILWNKELGSWERKMALLNS